MTTITRRGRAKGVVYSIGPSPLAAGDIWAGTDDGWVWRTRDGGDNWLNVTPAALTAWSKIGTIEPSRFDRDRAYIAVDRHRLDDPQPYVYRTIDGGRSWAAIVRGLSDGGPVNAVNVVREDPVRPGLLFAGTERGVFVSLDDGGHWAPLGRGLPTTSVRDIEVHGDDLVIATHGRGFYVLDDIEPLRDGGDRGGNAPVRPRRGDPRASGRISLERRCPGTSRWRRTHRKGRQLITAWRASRKVRWSSPSSTRMARSYAGSAAPTRSRPPI